MAKYLHTYNLAGKIIHSSDVPEDMPVEEALQRMLQNDNIQLIKHGKANKPHLEWGMFSWGPLGGCWLLTRVESRKPPRIDPTKIHFSSDDVREPIVPAHE
jgi:hypothetical protein